MRRPRPREGKGLAENHMGINSWSKMRTQNFRLPVQCFSVIELNETLNSVSLFFPGKDLNNLVLGLGSVDSCPQG